MRQDESIIYQAFIYALIILALFILGFYFLYINNFFVDSKPFDEGSLTGKKIEEESKLLPEKLENLKEEIKEEKTYSSGNSDPFSSEDEEMTDEMLKELGL